MESWILVLAVIGMILTLLGMVGGAVWIVRGIGSKADRVKDLLTIEIRHVGERVDNFEKNVSKLWKEHDRMNTRVSNLEGREMHRTQHGTDL